MALPNLKEYLIPETVEEVSAAIDRYGDNAIILAGGTFLHGLKSRGSISHVEALIDIQRLGLDKISANGGKINIGAGTRLGVLEVLPELEGSVSHAALVDALKLIPSQIKNIATVGGCVASSCPFFDPPTVFAALDGTVRCRDSKVGRTLEMTEFLTGMFKNALEQGEYIEVIELPAQPQRSASAFMKLDTQVNINVAVRIMLDSAGQCTDARIIIGGEVGDCIVRSHSAEQLLIGKELSADVFLSAGETASGDIQPFADHRGSAEYRRAITKVYVSRCLEKAQQRLGRENR